MLSMPQKWEEMPPGVKKAIIFLLAGWAAHYIFYFGFIAEDQPERVDDISTWGWASRSATV